MPGWRRAKACSCLRSSGLFIRLALPQARCPGPPGPARSSDTRPPLRQAPARGAETPAALAEPKAHEAPLLVDQGAGVVAPEPHGPAAAGQANALLDLVFAGGGGHASCCLASRRPAVGIGGFANTFQALAVAARQPVRRQSARRLQRDSLAAVPQSSTVTA